MKERPRILFCNCAYADLIGDDVRTEVLEGLSNSGVGFQAVSDLCGQAAERAASLRAFAEASDLRIAACYPRAVRWIFHLGGVDLPARGVKILNMRTLSSEKVLAGLLHGTEKSDRTIPIEPERLAAKPGQWVPWFPVIDYDRCTNCKKCLEFCLFGVFALTQERKVEVREARKCKTNCPACARICPQGAIMFPKYSASPINGDEVRQEDLESPEMGVDVDLLTGGDIYAKLRSRGGQIRGVSANARAAGSISDLASLKDALDIPQAVLDSLGSQCCSEESGTRDPGEDNSIDGRCDCGPRGEDCDRKDSQ